MRVKTLIPVLVCACAALLAGSVTASAATTELLTNGSFESGDFSGWTTTQPTQPLRPWSNATAVDRGYLDSASPQDGTHDALHGFDGSPGAYTLTQQVTFPAVSAATLAWKDRYQYQIFGFGAPRTVEVRILDTADALLATPYSLGIGPGTGDSGWQDHAVDVTGFSGRTVRVQFHFNVPENFTGPAQAELDAISLLVTPQPPALTSLVGILLPPSRPQPRPPAAVAPVVQASAACTSQRRLVVHLIRRDGLPYDLRGARITSATVIGPYDKPVPQRHTQTRATLDLRGLPKGRFTALVRIRLRSGKLVTFKRTYRTCTSRRSIQITPRDL